VTFLWPDQLWMALLLPLLVVAYVWLLRRRRTVALRLPNVALVKQAAGKSLSWRRHLPPLLLLLGFAALVVAAARPLAVITLPTDQQAIILAMDVSLSMRAADVAPDRISASQVAAKRFAAELPRNIRIGVVAMAARRRWCNRRRSVGRTWRPRSTAFSCSAAPPSAAAS
jgi:Ca-activated chloride channel family protein